MSNIIIKQTTKHLTDLDAVEKGHAFEDYIVTLFNKRKFVLLEWRSDKKASNGVYPVSCSYPDLEFHSRGTKKQRFAVECKWRQDLIDGGVYWAKKYQIKNYLDYQKENGIPVLIAIGLAGVPSHPDHLFITPIDHIRKYPHVFTSHLIPFKRNPEHSIDNSEQLKLF